MSNVGAVLYDKDAVYIDMPQIHFTAADNVEDWGSDEEAAKANADAIAASGEGVKLVKSLQQLTHGMDDRMSNAQFQLFKRSAATVDGDMSDEDDAEASDGDGSDDGLGTGESQGSDSKGSDDDGSDDQSGSSDGDDDDDDDDGDMSDDGEDEHTATGHSARWKSGLAEKAEAAFRSRCVCVCGSVLFFV